MGKTKKKKKKVYNPLETSMSLGDHLEELRARLIRAILGLLIGSIACLFFGRKIIEFIERPYFKIIQSHSSKSETGATQYSPNVLMETLCANILQALASDPNAPDIDPYTVEFIQRIFNETVVSLKSDPNYIDSFATSGQTSSTPRLQILAPADPFVGFMKISLISGLILSSPWVFYQLWMFVAAGLYANERRYVRISVPFSTVLFIAGALFFLFLIAPISLNFFLGFGDYIGVSSNWTFQKYISFVTLLMLVFGLGFQTPIAIFILNRTGLVSIKALKASRKYVFIGVFGVAAIATPPDVISQITLAIPLYALFELGILLSWFVERRKKLQEAAG